MDELFLKNGLDKLKIAVYVSKLLYTNNEDELKEVYKNFTNWISICIKRPLTKQEDLNLAKGIINFLNTEEIGNERTQAIDYLMEAEFLTT